MTKEQAVKEARVGSALKGGTFYVTRRGDKYNVCAADMYRNARKDGRIAEVIDIAAERQSRRIVEQDKLNRVAKSYAYEIDTQ